MRKLLLLTAVTLLQSNLEGQIINFSTNGYVFDLKAVDSMRYVEYPLSSLSELKLSKNDQRVNVMKYSFGLTVTTGEKKFINRKASYSTKYYVYKDGTLQAPTPTLFLKPIDPSNFIRKQKRLGTVEAHPNLSGYSYIFLKKKYKNENKVFELCNKLVRDKIASIVEPVFVKLIRVENPLLPKEWHIKNRGNIAGSILGADMGVEYSWNYSTGLGIKVAVIDDGVDLTHPDLQQNLLPGFDATGNNSSGGPTSSNYHGTNCAGIIASVNNNIGTKGVAFDARIIPIRLGIVTNGSFNTNDNWITNCFTEAVSRGADIISNSWGGGSPSAQIDAAIQHAISNGRSGTGCVVLFSAGNLNSNVIYPATNLNVIAVGASTPCDTRKRSSNNPGEVGTGVSIDPEGTSCDGERNWGSNFGVNLDVLAPGVLIPSTDNTGVNGFDPSDYNERFNGTSAACPNAAGVIALILSANPNLTGNQARKILEQTCFKFSNLVFQTGVPNQPNGTWNSQAGYGRINAELAVCQAKSICGTGNPPNANEYNYFTLAPFGDEIVYIKNSKVVSRINDQEKILAPSAPNARINSPVVTGGLSGEQHFYYIGEDDNIHDIYRRSSLIWNFGNLDPSTRCKPNTSIAADYANWSVNGSATLPFVFYVNDDNYIGCLEYNGLNWHNTVFNKGQSIKVGSPMTMIRQDGCPVLLYIGDDNKIHGFNKLHGQWYAIFPDANAPKCRSNSPLVSGKYGVPDLEHPDNPINLGEDAHCFYIGEDNKLYTIWTVKSMGGNWRTDCISQTVQVGGDSKLYFIRNPSNTALSKLAYQQTDGRINYFYATNGQWFNSNPVLVPSNLMPDNGSSIGYSNSLFYLNNSNVVRIHPF